MEPRTAVFITAYNEASTLDSILASMPDWDVFIIDDGSTDGTPAIANGYGAHVISHPINLGQGAAVITAFRVLSFKDYDIVIEMDGDGQHDPAEIPKFVETLERSGADIVAGSRLLGSNYDGAPLSRRLMLYPLTWTLNLLTGYRISDSMCGFRAFRGTAIQKLAPILNDMVETEYIASEMWLRFAELGLSATEVPINLASRKTGGSYKGHAFAKYGVGIIRTILRTLLESYRVRGQS